MSDKFKFATKLPEIRVVLFVVLGVGLWFLLVAGITPQGAGSISEAVPVETPVVHTQIAAANH